MVPSLREWPISTPTHWRAVEWQMLQHTTMSSSSLTQCFCWLLSVPATCWCISGTDLPRQVCLTSQQHASVSQGRICTDKFTCCHTEIEVADPTFHLTQSQYTDTGPTSPSADPITPGTWQGSHWSANF